MRTALHGDEHGALVLGLLKELDEFVEELPIGQVHHDRAGAAASTRCKMVVRDARSLFMHVTRRHGDRQMWGVAMRV